MSLRMDDDLDLVSTDLTGQAQNAPSVCLNDFLLDEKIIFLNHGSFGACPRAVFAVSQNWQRRLEAQPVLFLGRELMNLEYQARQTLGTYLGADPDDLVFIPNATYGVNIVARSLALRPGDEILTSDHEYGACDNTWRFICQKSGAHYKRQPLSLPLQPPSTSLDDGVMHYLEASRAKKDARSQDFIEQLWQGVTPRTKLIYLSHITSPTAQNFPVEAVCARARQEGILSLIDGAHAPGQLALDLQALGADFYTGNCHKWMLSPKGAGFLYSRREVQHLIEPLVVSWGYSADEKTTTGSRYIDVLQWTGTHDPSAVLSVPAAIQFMQEHDWAIIRQECHLLLLQALRRIEEITGLPAAYPETSTSNPHPLPPQMGIACLPYIQDLPALKARLYDEHRIEIPLIEWNGKQFVRISVQGYNTQQDIDALVDALRSELSTCC